MSAPAPRVSVAIVVHENRELVLASLTSLAADGGRHTRETIVLDNDSTDGSADAVAERFPEVTLIRRARRAGFGANHNTIAASARGEFLFALNDDTLVERGCIDALVDFLDATPSAAVAGPPILDARGEPDTFLLRFPSKRRVLENALWPWPQMPRWDAVAPQRVDWVNGCALMMRRRAFDDVGGFDEGFFMYAEEKDLCRRLARRGWESWLAPGPGLVHLGGQSSGGASERRDVEFWRSQRRYLAKHEGQAFGWGAPFASATANLQLWLASAAVLRLPAGVRPARVRAEAPAEYRRGFRSALRTGLRPDRGEGLRELAEDWNARRDAAAHDDSG